MPSALKTTAALALAGLAPCEAFRAGTVRMTVAEPTATIEPPPPPPLPKIQTMMVGDKTLAGDMNFDPLQLADSPGKLAWFREAEIKHARLAMLAAFGWPVSEITNFGKLLTNDGLGEVNGLYWGAVVALAIFAEAKGLDKQYG